MNTEILKVVKDLRSDLFYQIESKFGAEKASKYPSIVDADSLINKLTITDVVLPKGTLCDETESNRKNSSIATYTKHSKPEDYA